MILKREVTLLQRLTDSTFGKLNLDVYGATGRELGASAFAERTMTSNDNFTKAILPIVLGLDASSATWQTILSNYLYSINILVPVGGKIFDTSLNFDLSDKKIAQNVKILEAQLKKKFATVEDLKDYVIGYDSKGTKNVPEMEYYLYCKPVNNLDYFNYIYCTHHNKVANTHALITKSANIEFYLVTKEDVVTNKRKQFQLETKINKLLIEVEADEKKVSSMCSVLNIAGDDHIDKCIGLRELSKSNPERFVEIASDKHLTVKAQIEEYVRKGIIRRLPDSSMLVDANDPSNVIGATMNNAITYFNNKDNDGVLNQFSATYHSLAKADAKK